MGLSKRLIDLSTRDVEEALYPSEPWREFEEVYDQGIWPEMHCDPDDPCAECRWADEEEKRNLP